MVNWVIVDDQIKNSIEHWDVAAGTTVEGDLDLSDCQQLQSLPERLTVTGRLTLDGCLSMRELPRGLRCYELSAQGMPLRTVPEDIQVTSRMDLSDCEHLEGLPAGLKVATLILRGCISLRALPEALDSYFLDITRCLRIETFPEQGRERMGRLVARECTGLRELPNWLRGVGQLDVSGCQALRELPEHLQITGWLDLADTAITRLPASMQRTPLRWRSVRVDEQIAFRPQEIQADDVLKERNVERRRVLLERMGHERFIEQVQPKIVDTDTDPGGTRRLLRIEMTGDEPMFFLAVQCPSTGRQYTLRVPPTMSTSHQAAAWIAGFDNPDDYQPVAES
ncbi:MAG TPA: hypothetical protein VFB12_16060 [Ktedonobacteraceae bacterium]|nr:hypothetical protein [Ktedonobacteraceae bacterium]